MDSKSTAAELGRRPGLTPQTHWLVAAAAAVVRPDLAFLQDLARHASQHGIRPDVLREVGLQAIAYAGFPRALAALEALAQVLPATSEPAAERDAATLRRLGERHFGLVYGRHAPALEARLAELHPELAALTIEVAYGRLLSRPAIDGKTRELMGVATLAILDQSRQLVAHAFGARNFGASLDEVLAVITTVETCYPETALAAHGAQVRRHWAREASPG